MHRSTTSRHRSPRRLLAALLAASVLAASVLAGCGAAGPMRSTPAGRAGPAEAPVPSASPAGRVVTVGGTTTAVAVEAGGGRTAVGTGDAVVLLSPTGGITGRVPAPAPVHRIAARTGGGFAALAGDRLISVPAGDEVALPPGDGVALPAAGGDLASLDGGGVAVTLPDRGEVLVLDRAGTVVRTISTGGRPAAVALAGPSSVVRIAEPAATGDPAAGTGDRAAGAVAAASSSAMPAAGVPASSPGPAGTPPAAPEPQRIGVVDAVRSTVTVYRVDTGVRDGPAVPAGESATTMVSGPDGRLMLVDTRDGELLVFSVGPLVLRQRYPAAGAPYGMAYDPVRQRLWVTLTARNQVVGYDVTGGAPRELARHATVRQPDAVAVHPDGTVLVTGRVQGLVQLISA